jgi:glycosyltransferase involved in cell wall biosynthesis
MFKQVLFIAYYFPPMGGAGVQRSSKYAKYLPGCGWIPLVVSCDDPAFDRDTTLLSDVPRNLQVHRLRWRPHRRHHLHKMLFAIGLGQIATWDRLPDRHSRWYEDALEASRRIIKANRISVIYTTSAPYTSHLIGRTLAGETGIPWVADFRDEWSDNPDSMGSLPRWLAKRHVALEAQVAHEAAHCVFAHPVVAERFAKRHSIDHARVSTITNGYDPIDFAHRSAHAPEPNARAAAEEIHLVHVGSFYREYNEQPFLAALRLLRKRNSPSLVGLNVHFVGGVTHAKEDFTPACIQVYERRSHAEALQWMASADALLLVFPGQAFRVSRFRTSNIRSRTSTRHHC